MRGRLLLLGLGAALLFAGAAVHASDRAACRPTVRSIPTPAGLDALLQRIAVSPRGDVWAVGHLGSAPFTAVILHRTASRFVRVPAPPGTGELRDVVAPAADDAWAVGIDGVLHWDGRRWSRSHAPAGSYWAVAASGPDDVWAVGTGGGLLVSHWNGSAWKRVAFAPIPAASSTTAPGGTTYDSFSYLEGVLALAADDVWVVGTSSDGGPIAAHWDARQWLAYAVPVDFSGLGSLAADPSGDVWAAGGIRGGEFAAEWDGTAWRVRGPRASWIPDVAVRAGEAWTIQDDFLARWNGTAWIPLEKRHPDLALKGLAVDGRGDVWAAGFWLGSAPKPRSAVYRYSCSR